MRKINIKFLVSTLLLLFHILSMSAQGPECLFIHFDKSFYASGETIWFKAYQIGALNEARSRVLHVDLVNHQNILISSQKLPIEGGCAIGSIKLPMDALEGFYRFRAYTRYNLNFDPSVIYRAEIPVYSLDGETLPDHHQEKDMKPARTSGIAVFTDQEIYLPRDSLSVSFKVNGSSDQSMEGSFSISIVPSELVGTEFQFDQESACASSVPKPGRIILPERTLFVEGSLIDPSTGNEISSRLLSVYVGQTSQLIRASARDGQLKVAVPDYNGPGFFQILNLDPYSTTVPKLLPAPNLPEDAYFNPGPPLRTPIVSQYLDKLTRRRKIIELFDLYNTPQVETEVYDLRIPDAVYTTTDFNRIYSFEQFINEAIPNVRVREIDGSKTVRLFNREQGRLFEDHPWYMVDGFLTFNEQQVLQIPYPDIVEVRLYSKTTTLEKYFQGFMFRSGIMEITTRDVKYVRELKASPNVIEIEGFSPPANFHEMLNPTGDKLIPDLRGTTYWSPEVYTDSLGNGQITIPLSDDTGNFAIVVMGTNNQRLPVAGYQTFKVELKP